MQKLKLSLAAAAAALSFAGSSALAETSSFDASATIQEALALTNVANLAFATIVPDATTGGDVVVSAAGARSCAAVLTCTGSVAAADFSVTGSDGASYALTLPGTANITSGANSMAVSAFTSSLTGSTGTLTGGSDSFQIGGTLTVGANQAAGAYTGTFNVTVEYN